MSTEQMSQRLLTPDQAGAYLGGVARQTLAIWRLRGQGPAYIKLEGRLVRYEQGELDRYIAKNRRTSTSSPVTLRRLRPDA
jgi:hypothetical protein